MKASNLSRLVEDARTFGSASASGRKWQAFRRGRGSFVDVEVFHYSTHLVTVRRDGGVVPVNRGWGSTTDRCGIRRITGQSYRDVFDGAEAVVA